MPKLSIVNLVYILGSILATLNVRLVNELLDPIVVLTKVGEEELPRKKNIL